MTEEERIEESRSRSAHWKRWGPYLSERQWGTVREDYSPDGDAWAYFPREHATSRAYRWGEDGIGGICDRHQFICFALALWNGHDPILKERLFGLGGPEGNHGEDVKESYFYLDSTPTHSYMQFLYKYPQAEFPYARLLEENRQRSRDLPEFELLDTGIFEGDRYFDVFVEYAKESVEEILIRITAHNRGPDPAKLHLLPTLWFRNTWSWGGPESRQPRPKLSRVEAPPAAGAVIQVEHSAYGTRWLICGGEPELLFTENETNFQRVFGTPNSSPYVKDSFHDYVVHGQPSAVNPEKVGTKAAARYWLRLGPSESGTLCLRFTPERPGAQPFGKAFDEVFNARKEEGLDFYATRIGKCISRETTEIQRQAFAGLLWTKQFYNYDVRTWLAGDPTQPPPPESRKHGRNHDWAHLYNSDVISMPDKWEYPWYASWDLAFHCVALALIDPDYAKELLILFLREWYMHPNGHIPSYEWSFGDANPPVHAWAAWRVYKIEKRIRGQADRVFLERVFHKLLLNFTWWVNRKDPEGMNVFQGGFLGLDNVGVFDRSAPLPLGGHIEQSDGTSWMAMYCLNLLAIALELARDNPAYEDVASKFFEHFVYISDAMNNRGGEGIDLWDEEDGFYYDVLRLPDGSSHKLKVRSTVGLIPLLAVEIIEPETIDALPGFRKRSRWFIENRPEFRRHLCIQTQQDGRLRGLLSLVGQERLPRVLRLMLDENEFLSPFGIRSLSRFHRDHPYVLYTDGHEHRVDYEPAESRSSIFGGNSNWRGPVWFPLNFLFVESLQKFDYFFGDQLKVECPTGSGHMLTLWQAAAEISRRLIHLFLRDDSGQRPIYRGQPKFQNDPHWRDLIQFYEYFHGDNGAGLGASHQTGWTALVAKLIEQSGE